MLITKLHSVVVSSGIAFVLIAVPVHLMAQSDPETAARQAKIDQYQAESDKIDTEEHENEEFAGGDLNTQDRIGDDDKIAAENRRIAEAEVREQQAENAEGQN